MNKNKVIIDNSNSEQFSKSKCSCRICKEMEEGYSTGWKSWNPVTKGEKYYKNKINEIEKKYVKKNNKV